MKNKFNIELNNQKFEVEFIRDLIFKQHKLRVNDNIYSIKYNLINEWLGYDVPIMLGDKKVKIVKQLNFFDIAIDDKYILSNKEYKPIKYMPIWNWTFIIINILMPLLIFDEAIATILSAYWGIYFCTLVSMHVNIKNKFLWNILITIGWLVLTYLLIYILWPNL